MNVKIVKHVRQKGDLTINTAQVVGRQTLVDEFDCLGYGLTAIEGAIIHIKKGNWQQKDNGVVGLFVNAYDVIHVSQKSIESEILNSIRKNENDGHSCMLLSDLVKVNGVSETDVNQAVLSLLAKKLIKIDGKMVYRYETFEMEKTLARDMIRLQMTKRNVFSKKHIEEEMKIEMERLGIVLAREQKNACIRTLSNQVSIITGGAGTGKTTIVRVITNIYLKHFPNSSIRLLSPTGKAAIELNKGLQEHIDQNTQEKANTIHSHLGLLPEQDGSIRRVKDVKIKEEFLIVDEFSMVDLNVAKELFASALNGVKILILGDINQIESIGIGQVFYDLIKSYMVPTTTLDRVYRQADDSLISMNAARTNRGNGNLDYGSDFQLIETKDCAESATKIKEIYLDLLKTEKIEDIMILSPYRRYTESGCNALNREFRDIVNPPSADKKEKKIEKMVYREGDRIVFTKNTPITRNGEVGTIESIRPGKIVFVMDKNKKIVEMETDKDIYLDLAYALTIYKSQGSEYKICILTINDEHKHLSRNMFYTAITRAKKKIILVGENEAVKRAINTKMEIKNSKLSKRIVDLMENVRNINKGGIEHDDKKRIFGNAGNGRKCVHSS